MHNTGTSLYQKRTSTLGTVPPDEPGSVVINGDTVLNPAQGFEFKTSDNDPKGLCGLLQYLANEGPQLKMRGSVHAAAINTDHSSKHIEGTFGTSKNRTIRRNIEEVMPVALAAIERVKTEQDSANQDYKYTENDRHAFRLAKEMFSAIVAWRSEDAVKHQHEDDGLQNAIHQFRTIVDARKALQEKLNQLNPPVPDEALNLAAIAYEGMYKIFIHQLEPSKEIECAAKIVALSNGTASQELQEMKAAVEGLEKEGSQTLFSDAFGNEKPGKEVFTGQVGFTDGEPMGATYLYDDIAVIIRNTREVKDENGKVTAKKGAMAMAVLDDQRASPAFIKGIFDEFLKLHPGVELADLEVSMIGGKANNRFAEYDASKLPNFDRMDDDAIAAFQKKAGVGVISALRVLDYVTEQKIPLGKNYLFRDDQPASFVVKGEENKLHVSLGRPEQTRPEAGAAHLITKLNLNNNLANIAFRSADEGYHPLIIPRTKLSNVEELYNISFLNGFMDQVTNLKPNSSSMSQFAMACSAPDFMNMIDKEIIIPFAAPLSRKAQVILDPKILTQRDYTIPDATKNASHEMVHDFFAKGVTVAVLGDEKKNHHNEAKKLVETATDYKQHNLIPYKRQVRGGEASLVPEQSFFNALKNKSDEVEKRAAKDTIGYFSQQGRQKKPASPLATLS